MQAVCLHLYRDDPDIDMNKIMKMNQFNNLKQQVLCLTPRRVSFYALILLITSSNIN